MGASDRGQLTGGIWSDTLFEDYYAGSDIKAIPSANFDTFDYTVCDFRQLMYIKSAE